jgi:outer membrane protein OmpA-like peptidoglycan-associated protein
MQTKLFNKPMRHFIQIETLLVAFAFGLPATAQTADGSLSLSTDGASASAGAAAPAPAEPEPAPAADVEGLGPEGNLWELGLFGGVMFPSEDHNLRRQARAQQPFKTSGELGARLAYFPLSFFGIEAEGALMPSELDDGSSGALYAGRGHAVLQIPMGAFTPFAVVGGGVLAAASTAMGKDRDPAFHFGLGGKVALDEYISLRLDLRDTMTQKFDASQGTQTHHPEALLGLTFTLERQNPDTDGDGFANHRDDCPSVPGDEQGCPPPVADEDGDGVSDATDQCKGAKGLAPSGCPDTDGDGKLDPDDLCPKQAAQTPDGCPKCPVVDRDGDGRTDAMDKCPDEPAQTADGCIDLDPDRDGIPDPTDKCPKQAETANGFQDQDGCPDEVPAAIKKFSGVIRGIQFATNSADITPGSKPLLNEAAKVLTEFPDLKLEISGHTDTQGQREHNLDLSKRRADSVKAYMVEQGVPADRLATRGAGPDEPIADNKTNAGRAQNRRIEFKNISK